MRSQCNPRRASGLFAAIGQDAAGRARHREDNGLAAGRFPSLALLIMLAAPWTICCPAPLHAGRSPQASEKQALLQADEASKRLDYPRAIALYRQVLSSHPGDTGALLGLGKAYLLSRQFKLAVDTYQLALDQDPQNQNALIGIGEAYTLLGEYAQAEGPLKRAVRAAPGDANAAWALSRAEFYERRFADAQRLLERAVKENPKDFRLWESLGEVQWEQRHRAAARQSLQRALELNPNAKRAQILLQKVEAQGKSETGLKVGYHSYGYLLNDAVGNQILSIPQTLNLSYGSHWRTHLTGEYRRAAFRQASEAGPAPEGSEVTPAGGALGTLAVNIFSVTDSTEYKVNEALTLTGGGGVAQYLGKGMTRNLYNGGLRVSPTSHLQLSYSYGQRIVAPTELAARLGLTARGSSSHLTYNFPQATTLDLSYYQDRVSDSNSYRGGYGELRRVIVQRPFELSVGYKLESLSYARLDLFHGYFSPKRFIANSGVVNLRGQQGRLHYNYDFDIGQESYTRPVVLSITPFSFVAQRRSSPRFMAQLRHSYELNRQWSFQASVLFYRSALSSGTGSYKAYGILFGLTRNF